MSARLARLLQAACWLAWPAAASAQQAEGSIPGMDHDAMPGMAMPAPQAGAQPAAATDMDHHAMPGMDHGAMPGMRMGSMQGGGAPPDARSPDYADGIAPSHLPGMDMHDDALRGMLLLDQFEAVHGRDANGQAWEAEGWYGGDWDKLWLRTEGERSAGRLEEGNLEALWNHAVGIYWGSQLGLRQDVGAGPHRTWAAFGIQGLAPYWFELEATGYVGESGRTAARLRAEYELLFTQRLILQPELEANLYGKKDPAARTGSGLADLRLGLRLRYEIRRQFAPYLGIQWVRLVGGSADYARQDGRPVFDRQFVAGLRIWF